jgi:hypothetical protein
MIVFVFYPFSLNTGPEGSFFSVIFFFEITIAVFCGFSVTKNIEIRSQTDGWGFFLPAPMLPAIIFLPFRGEDKFIYELRLSLLRRTTK